MRKIDKTNEIDPSATIGDNVILGKHNVIGKNVVLGDFKGKKGKILLGDCNTINDNTRIMSGEEGIEIGDWNVFHNNMPVFGEQKMTIGHNCWFGQNTILDSSGSLVLGNGVRVGMYSQIWTHVASGELIEGCTLFGKRKTIIEDNVWLVGSCIVSSGITIKEKCICLIGSNITKNTDSNSVYAGSPAKKMEKLEFYKPITLSEKFELMLNWVMEFAEINSGVNFSNTNDTIDISLEKEPNTIKIIKEGKMDVASQVSIFNLKSKKYTKNLSAIERMFYRYIFDHKARFIPV